MRAKILFTALALTALFYGAQASADPTKPWELRNAYRIPIEKGVLIYAEDTAEWRVLTESGQVLADRVGFRVQLEDGTELKGTALGDGVSGRERFSDDFGDGMVYSVTFTPKQGVRLTHYLRTYRARPFVFVEIAVENVGTSDIKLAAIQPVKAEKSVMQALSPQSTVRHRRILDTGGQPVAVPGGDATMAVLYDPSRPISFGVGLVPKGQARSTVTFKQAGGEWHGEITCNYEPYKVLKPGEKLLSDPLWLSHGVPEPDRVDMNYSWVYSVLTKVPQRPFTERGWFTLAEDQGLESYIAAAGGWKSAGIDHALFGRGWEDRPGSMEGASGRFPKNMKEAVGGLDKAGVKAGITIDPLAAKGDGAAKSADGLAWLNPATPEGEAALADKIKEVKSWGAAFVVVDYSTIPDDVVAGFNLTRAEAQNLAYKSLRQAADPLPVYPSSVSSVGADLNAWLDAGSAVARMAVYGMSPGPLSCVLDSNADFSEDTIAAAQFWPGPIEFRGNLDKKHQSDVEKLLKLERIAAHPLDAGHDFPKTWRLQKHDAAGAVVEDRTLIVGQFEGVPASVEAVTNQAANAEEAQAERARAEAAKAEAEKAEAEKAEAEKAAKQAAKAEKAEAKKAAKEAEKAEKAQAEQAAEAETANEETGKSAKSVHTPKSGDSAVETADAAESAPASEEAPAAEAAASEAPAGETPPNVATAKAEDAESDKDDDGERTVMKKLKRVWPF